MNFGKNEFSEKSMTKKRLRSEPKIRHKRKKRDQNWSRFPKCDQNWSHLCNLLGARKRPHFSEKFNFLGENFVKDSLFSSFLLPLLFHPSFFLLSASFFPSFLLTPAFFLLPSYLFLLPFFLSPFLLLLSSFENEAAVVRFALKIVRSLKFESQARLKKDTFARPFLNINLHRNCA